METENPLEEVWANVALHGSADFLRKNFIPLAGQPIDPYIKYASIRVRQAVEFRGSPRWSDLVILG